jgi:drug/metabolite transporter (DMT)-like permease
MVMGGLSRKLRSRLDVVAALLVLYIVWSTTYFALSIALTGFPPFRLASLRFAIAGTLLFFSLVARGTPWPTRREWLDSAKVGFLLLVISNGGITFAQKSISSSLAAIVVSSMPLWATLFAALFGTKPSKRELVGLFVGFVGVIVLNAGGELYVDGLVAGALLLAPISWAFGSMWSKKLSLPAGPMAPAAQMLIAAVVLAIISLATGEQSTGTPGPAAIGAFVYLVFFGSMISLIAYAHLLRSTRPAIATSYAYVNPLLAVMIGVGFADESVAPLTIAGGLVILTGVVIVLTRRY